MSHNAHDGANSGSHRTPSGKAELWFVALMLLAGLGYYVLSHTRPSGAESASHIGTTVAQRIQKVGSVVVADSATPANAAASAAAGGGAQAPKAEATAATTGGGEALYQQTCLACHASGVAGAPKLGDKAAWAARIATGVDAMTSSVMKGKGAMPPKGGSAAPDADIKSAVQYMVGAAK